MTMKKSVVPTLLFDLDGTLVDTDRLHLQAYNTLLSRYDRAMSVDYYKAHVMGFPNDQIFRGLFPDENVHQHLNLANEKENLVRALFTKLDPMPGILDLIDRADALGCPKAVVTNAPRLNAQLLLDGLGLRHRFSTLVLGEELEHGKPHPMPYATALALLGSKADAAFAFEDSLSGVRSASSAGIRTFGVMTSLPEDRLRAAGAFHVIADFLDVDMQTLLDPLFAEAEHE